MTDANTMYKRAIMLEAIKTTETLGGCSYRKRISETELIETK